MGWVPPTTMFSMLTSIHVVDPDGRIDTVTSAGMDRYGRLVQAVFPSPALIRWVSDSMPSSPAMSTGLTDAHRAAVSILVRTRPLMFWVAIS